MKLELTPAEIATLKLALAGWAARCDQEAKTMRDWSKDARLSHLVSKCEANAIASECFAQEARDLAAKL